MARTVLIAFNKPWGMLSQFSDREGRPVLADVLSLPGYRVAGRLDRDSEGLLLLTRDGRLQARITEPRHKLPKTYLVQVEGVPRAEQLERLRKGVKLKDGMTRPAQVRLLAGKPGWLWPRTPPVRFRKRVPTHWLELTLTEGRNRQVRRMTAAVGLPTLRLIRSRIGAVGLDGLAPGQWRALEADAPWGGTGSQTR